MSETPGDINQPKGEDPAFKLVRDLAVELFGLDRASLTPDANLFGDLNTDGLAYAEFFFKLETDEGLQFGVKEIAAVINVGQAVDLVRTKLQEKITPPDD